MSVLNGKQRLTTLYEFVQDGFAFFADMDDVPLSFCHLYSVYRFLLFCHDKRPPMIFSFIIEDLENTFYRKNFTYSLISDVFLT